MRNKKSPRAKRARLKRRKILGSDDNVVAVLFGDLRRSYILAFFLAPRSSFSSFFSNEDHFYFISFLLFLIVDRPFDKSFIFLCCLWVYMRELLNAMVDNQYANDHQNANYLTFTSWSLGKTFRINAVKRFTGFWSWRKKEILLLVAVVVSSFSLIIKFFGFFI